MKIKENNEPKRMIKSGRLLDIRNTYVATFSTIPVSCLALSRFSNSPLDEARRIGGTMQPESIGPFPWETGSRCPYTERARPSGRAGHGVALSQRAQIRSASFFFLSFAPVRRRFAVATRHCRRSPNPCRRL